MWTGIPRRIWLNRSSVESAWNGVMHKKCAVRECRTALVKVYDGSCEPSRKSQNEEQWA